jgi:hypothetical protein
MTKVEKQSRGSGKKSFCLIFPAVVYGLFITLFLHRCWIIFTLKSQQNIVDLSGMQMNSPIKI